MDSINMRLVRPILTFGLMALVTTPLVAQGNPCERAAEAFYLKIKYKHGEPTEVLRGNENADELHVCRGDTIEWHLQGQMKKFSVDFLDDKTPFDEVSKPSSNGKITATVRADAARGDYTYDITVEDEVIDPVIVVDGDF